MVNNRKTEETLCLVLLVGHKILAIQIYDRKVYALYNTESRSVGVSVYDLTKEQIKEETAWEAEGLKRCRGFVVKNDKVFIADKDKKRIRVYTLDGTVSEDASKQTVEHEMLRNKIHLIQRNYIMISDKDGNPVYKLNEETLKLEKDNTRYPVMDMFCVDVLCCLWAWNKGGNQLIRTQTTSGKLLLV